MRNNHVHHIRNTAPQGENIWPGAHGILIIGNTDKAVRNVRSMATGSTTARRDFRDADDQRLCRWFYHQQQHDLPLLEHCDRCGGRLCGQPRSDPQLCPQRRDLRQRALRDRELARRTARRRFRGHCHLCRRFTEHHHRAEPHLRLRPRHRGGERDRRLSYDGLLCAQQRGLRLLAHGHLHGGYLNYTTGGSENCYIVNNTLYANNRMEGASGRSRARSA